MPREVTAALESIVGWAWGCIIAAPSAAQPRPLAYYSRYNRATRFDPTF